MTLRAEVRTFAEAMEAKLRENDHKGHWNNGSAMAADYVRRLSEETAELVDVLRQRADLRDYPDDWRRRVLREAADIANFAMFIADVCGALGEPQGEGADE